MADPQTRALYNPEDQKIYDVPLTDADAAIEAGYLPTQPLTNPEDQKIYDVPQVDVPDAIASGYKPQADVPVLESPEETVEGRPTPEQIKAQNEEALYKLKHPFPMLESAETQNGVERRPGGFVSDDEIKRRQEQGLLGTLGETLSSKTDAAVEGVLQPFGIHAPLDYAKASAFYTQDKLTGKDTTFDQALAEARADTKAIAEAEPEFAAGGGIIGSIGAGGAAAKLLAKVPGVAPAIAKITPAASSSWVLKGAFGASAAVGGGYASGAAQNAAVELDRIHETGDYTNLGEKLWAAAKEGGETGAWWGGALYAAPAIVKGLKGWANKKAEQSAFKAVVGRTNQKAYDKADVHGGPEAVGRTILDEGLPITGKAEDIYKAAKTRRDELGQQLGDLAAEADNLKGEPLSRKELWDLLDNEVQTLKKSGAKRALGRSVENKLKDIRDDLIGPPPKKGKANLEPFAEPTPTPKVPEPEVPPAAPKPQLELEVPNVPRGTQMELDLPAKKPAAVPEPVPPPVIPEVPPVPDVTLPKHLQPLTFEEVRKLRLDMDDILYGERKNVVKSAIGLEYKKGRNVVEDFWMKKAGERANAAGRPEYMDQYKNLKTRYAHVSLATDEANEAVKNQLKNRAFSLSDYLVMGAVTSSTSTGGEISEKVKKEFGGGIPGEIAGRGAGLAVGLVYGAANKLLRHHGRGNVARGLNNVQRGLNGVSKVLPKPAVRRTIIIEQVKKDSEEKRKEEKEKLQSSITKEIDRIAALQKVDTPESAEYAQNLKELEQYGGVELAQAYAAQGKKRNEFVMSKVPPTYADSLMSTPEHVFSDDALRELDEAMAAADDPIGALERLGRGDNTPADTEALQTLYPSMLAEWRQKAVEHVMPQLASMDYDDQLILQQRIGVDFVAEGATIAWWQSHGLGAGGAGQPEEASGQSRSGQSRRKVELPDARTRSERLG